MFRRGCLALVALLLASPLAAQEKEPPLAKVRPQLTSAKVQQLDRVYKETPQGELKLHLFLPADWKAADQRPVIVFFFGGGWRHGTYEQFVPQAEYFASRGLVAAAADYRIASVHKTTPAECVADAKSAIRWVRQHAAELGVDPGKVISAGGSAGGHLAAATAFVPEFNAPSDDLKISAVPQALVLFNPGLNLAGREFLDLNGKNVADAISPLAFVGKDAPPTIIFFGTADTLISHGEQYLAKAAELGVQAELYTAADMPHAFFNRSPWLELTAEKADEFSTKLGYLSGKPTIQRADDRTVLKPATLGDLAQIRAAQEAAERAAAQQAAEQAAKEAAKEALKRAGGAK